MTAVCTLCGWQTSTEHIHFVRTLNWTICTETVNTIQYQLYSGTAALCYREKFSQILLLMPVEYFLTELRVLACFFRAQLINSFDERYKAIICNHFSTVCILYSTVRYSIIWRPCLLTNVGKLVLADRNVTASWFYRDEWFV